MRRSLETYLDESRRLVEEEITHLLPKNRYRRVLYDLVLDYPLRSAKALRPALCIAACRALGGRLEDVLPSAAVLELFHNAFLIHDDIEDGSLLRRGRPTLHVEHGVPIAVNVGDAMLALSLEPLLDNMRVLDLGRALRVLQIISRMARESAEGQAIELDWIRRGDFDLRPRDYREMVFKKTCWYTFIAPLWIGAVIARGSPAVVTLFRRFAALLGVAFQIQDDVLNLEADESAYGKEIAGDLWEGKRTLILLDFMQTAAPEERSRAVEILSTPRPDKRASDIEALLSMIREVGSLRRARAVAEGYAARARKLLDRLAGLIGESEHTTLLDDLTAYVTGRER